MHHNGFCIMPIKRSDLQVTNLLALIAHNGPATRNKTQEPLPEGLARVIALVKMLETES